MLNKIVYYYLLSWMAIEMFGGYLMGTGSNLFTYVKLAKLLFLFFVLLCILKRDLYKFIFLLTIMVVLTSLILLQSISYGLEFRSIEIVIKILLPLAVTYYFFCEYDSAQLKKVQNIIFLNFSFLSLNMLISHFGYGFFTYEAGELQFGGSGLLNARNEISGALIFAMGCLYLIFPKNISYFIAISLALIICATALATKSSIVAVALGVGWFSWKISKKITLMLGLLAFITGFYVYELIVSVLEFSINRWVYLLNEYGPGYMLMGGFKRVTEINLFISHLMNEPVDFFIGSGWSGVMENNFFDLLQSFGVFGLFLLLLWIKLLFPSAIYRVRLQGAENKVFSGSRLSYYFVSGLILITLVLAGHIVQSTLIVPFAAAYFLYGAKDI